MSALQAIHVRKELRELLPWWAGTVVAVLSCAGLSRLATSRIDSSTFQWLLVGGLIYAAGTITLGGVSIGHEYTHRTLGALLAQPVDRRRVLMTKFAVLVPMVAALTLVEWFALSSADYPSLSWRTEATVAVLVALFIAPWLTMMCRGPLAASVFAMAIPLLFLTIDRATWPLFRDWNLMWQGTTLLAAIGAIMTWRTFRTLEAIDGPHAEIDPPAWLRQRALADRLPTRSRGRAWQVVRKELHLQQMSFLVSVFYVAIWIGFAAARNVAGAFTQSDPSVITILYSGLIAVMTGALASGEERHLGTADWQLLLPMPAWKQWAIKAGLAISLALGLAVGLPALLASMRPWPDWSFHKEIVYAVVMLSVAALYVSSLSSSGMRALLVSFPAIAGSALIANAVVSPLRTIAYHFFRPIAETVGPFIGVSHFGDFSYGGLMDVRWMLVAGLALILLRLGYTNHRSAERGIARVRRQVIWIASYVITGMLMYSLVLAVFTASLARR